MDRKLLSAWLQGRSRFWVRGWCFDRLRCDSDSIRFTLPCSNSDKQFCHNKDEFLSTDCGAFTDAEFTMRQCEWQRALTFHRRQKYCMYARFIKEDDNNFSVMSRVVVGQTLKLLQRSMKKRMMCYFLVRPQQPLRALFWCCRLWWNINLRKKHFVTCLQWLKLTAGAPQTQQTEEGSHRNFSSLWAKRKRRMLNTSFVFTPMHNVAKVLRIIEEKLKWRDLVTCVVKVFLAHVDGIRSIRPGQFPPISGQFSPPQFKDNLPPKKKTRRLLHIR